MATIDEISNGEELSSVRTKLNLLINETNSLTSSVGPITVSFKNVTVLTSGAASDVASVTLPSWLTRWRLVSSVGGLIEAVSASGTLAGAQFSIRDAANAAANAVSPNFVGPASTSLVVSIGATSTSTLSSSSNTIYLRQETNSANAGTASVYLTLMPCL